MQRSRCALTSCCAYHCDKRQTWIASSECWPVLTWLVHVSCSSCKITSGPLLTALAELLLIEVLHCGNWEFSIFWAKIVENITEPDIRYICHYPHTIYSIFSHWSSANNTKNPGNKCRLKPAKVPKTFLQFCCYYWMKCWQTIADIIALQQICWHQNNAVVRQPVCHPGHMQPTSTTP